MKIARMDFPDFQKSRFNMEQVMRNLPTWAGNAALNFYRDSFRRGGYINNGFERWPKRKPSLMGNLDAGRALLVKSGALRRSLRLQTGNKYFEVSSALPYAKAHNEGETITQTVTAKQRRFFWAMHHKYKAMNQGGLAGAWKGLAQSQTLTIKMLRRQFMDVPGGKMSPFLERRILMHLERALENALV